MVQLIYLHLIIGPVMLNLIQHRLLLYRAFAIPGSGPGQALNRVQDDKVHVAQMVQLFIWKAFFDILNI